MGITGFFQAASFLAQPEWLSGSQQRHCTRAHLLQLCVECCSWGTVEVTALAPPVGCGSHRVLGLRSAFTLAEPDAPGFVSSGDVMLSCTFVFSSDVSNAQVTK